MVVVSKLNPSGSALSYSSFLGGADNDIGLAIAVDRWGRATVTGQTRATNFPTTASSLKLKSIRDDVIIELFSFDPEGLCA
jgi:hypothetical protein